MALPALVLVHGGEHAADCWDLTVAELQRHAPHLKVLAVDLPGRRDKPGHLESARISDWADSVVDDITDAGLDDVVIVGHSMAGVTVPAVAERLGWPRVRELILLCAFVPRQGESIIDSLDGPLAWLARRGVRAAKPMVMPRLAVRYAFCNGMSAERRKFALDRIYTDAVSITGETVDRAGLPDSIPRTWILTTRDRTLSVKSQRRSLDALGGVKNIVSMAACHDAMISHPEQLASILIERCRQAQRSCS